MSTKFDSQLKESEIAERESAPRASFETAERNAVPPEPGGDDDALKEQHRSPGSSERYALGWSQSTLAAKLQIGKARNCLIAR